MTTEPTTSPSDPTLLTAIRWVLDHEILERGSTRTYPAQVAMFVWRHFGGLAHTEPRVVDVEIILRAMGLPSSPFTFTGRRIRGARESVTVPMFDLSRLVRGAS